MTMRPREERGFINHERRLDDLEADMLRLKQSLPGLYQGAGGGQSSGGGGRKACKATTDIDARSGATFGTGTVQPVKDDGGTLVDDGDTVDVGNLGGLISSGKYCMYWTDDYGSKWVEPEECESP